MSAKGKMCWEICFNNCQSYIESSIFLSILMTKYKFRVIRDSSHGYLGKWATHKIFSPYNNFYGSTTICNSGKLLPSTSDDLMSRYSLEFIKHNHDY